MPANIGEIPHLFERLRNFCADCAVPADVEFKIQLALDELINNIIDHGYHGRQPGEISILIARTGDNVDIELQDDAALFDPFSVASPDLDASVEDRPLGGIGVHLVRTLMDSFKYSVRNERNHVHLRLALEGVS